MMSARFSCRFLQEETYSDERKWHFYFVKGNRLNSYELRRFFVFGESCTFYLQRRRIWPLSRIASPYKAVVGADCPTTIGCLGEGEECISRDRCFLSQRVRGESEECRTNLCRNRVFCSPLCSIVGVRRLQSRESL